MKSIDEILKEKIEFYKTNPSKEEMNRVSKDYQKRWARGVQYFQKRINIERVKEGRSPLAFIAIRQKVNHIEDIEILKWFYGQCVAYESKGVEEARKMGVKNEKTFSKCFFGSLKIK